MQCRYLAAVCNPNSLPFPGYRSFVYCSLILGWRMDVLLPSDRAKRRETCVLSGTSSAFVAHLSRQNGCQFLLSVSKLQSLALEWNSGFAEALLVAWLGFFFEICVPGLLGRTRILLQCTCFHRLSIMAEQHWCRGVNVYLCISTLEQRDGEAGD